MPGKNLRLVGGVPLVGRAVASARRAGLIDDVYVSTDDAAIADTARAFGAMVVDRPGVLAGDTASSESALLHVLDCLENEQIRADVVVFIQATSPFIDPADLDAAVARVRDGEWDSAFSARRTHAFLWHRTSTGAEGINHDETYRLRRQDLEPQFEETGAFYVMRADGLRETGYRFFGRIGIAVVPELTAVDIDSVDDLELANLVATLHPVKEESWSPSA